MAPAIRPEQAIIYSQGVYKIPLIAYGRQACFSKIMGEYAENQTISPALSSPAILSAANWSSSTGNNSGLYVTNKKSIASDWYLSLRYP
jgi:hypothetical protein